MACTRRVMTDSRCTPTSRRRKPRRAPRARLRSQSATAGEIAARMVALHGAVTSDKTATAEASAIRARDGALRLAEQAAKALDRGRKTAATEIAKILAETSAPPAPKGSDPVAIALESEIRASLRGMTREERGKALAAAVSNGDDATVGAFLRGPTYLTGGSDTEREMRRHAWRLARHPEAVDREARLKKAIAATEQGAKALIAFTKELAESPETVIAEASARRASEALAAVKQEEAA